MNGGSWSQMLYGQFDSSVGGVTEFPFIDYLFMIECWRFRSSWQHVVYRDLVDKLPCFKTIRKRNVMEDGKWLHYQTLSTLTLWPNDLYFFKSFPNLVRTVHELRVQLLSARVNESSSVGARLSVA